MLHSTDDKASEDPHIQRQRRAPGKLGEDWASERCACIKAKVSPPTLELGRVECLRICERCERYERGGRGATRRQGGGTRTDRSVDELPCLPERRRRLARGVEESRDERIAETVNCRRGTWVADWAVTGR